MSDDIYAFQAEDFRKLKRIMEDLFAPEILTPDKRRDLANEMYVVLGNAVALPESILDQPKP